MGKSSGAGSLLGGCALLPLSRSLFEFGAMLLIVGAGADVGDVAMNVQGHLVEERRVKVLMPYWHGTFFYRRGFRSSLRLALCLVWATTTHYLQDRIPRSCVGTGPFRRAVVSGPRTIPLSKSVTGQVMATCP